MTTTCERHLHIEAWALSLIMHGIAVTLAVLFVSQIKPLQLQDTFEWNVSIVEAPREELAASNAQPEPSPAPAQPILSQVQPIQPVTETPQTVTREIQTRQLNLVVQEEQPQLLEAPKAIERPAVETMTQSPVIQHQHEAVTQVLEPVQEVTPVRATQQAERLPDVAVQSVVPVEAPSRIETDATVLHSPAMTSTPQPEHKESLDVRPVVPSVIDSSPVQKADETRVESQLVRQAAVPRESVIPQVSVEPVQSVTKAVQQGPAARADYGWLVESIGKRLADLKRYPPAARLHGWEGKVVLRAVITADGNLADVKVQRSSGHEELDEAAMESMRQACPLHMRHDLGRPDIVVNIPVLYALAK